MGKNKTMSLDAFKEIMASDEEKKNEIIGRSDLIDLDNGVMRIYSEHVNKYLEKYACRDANDLSETLWYSYGIFCQVID